MSEKKSCSSSPTQSEISTSLPPDRQRRKRELRTFSFSDDENKPPSPKVPILKLQCFFFFSFLTISLNSLMVNDTGITLISIWHQLNFLSLFLKDPKFRFTCMSRIIQRSNNNNPYQGESLSEWQLILSYKSFIGSLLVVYQSFRENCLFDIFHDICGFFRNRLFISFWLLLNHFVCRFICAYYITHTHIMRMEE